MWCWEGCMHMRPAPAGCTRSSHSLHSIVGVPRARPLTSAPAAAALHGSIREPHHGKFRQHILVGDVPQPLGPGIGVAARPAAQGGQAPRADAAVGVGALGGSVAVAKGGSRVAKHGVEDVCVDAIGHLGGAVGSDAAGASAGAGGRGGAVGWLALLCRAGQW